MDRRDFVKLGLGTAVALVAGRYVELPVISPRRAYAEEHTGTFFEFTVREAMQENAVDSSLVYHWTWQCLTDAPIIAGETLILEVGVPVTVKVYNTLDEPHGWAVTDRFGGYQVNTGPIAPGGSAQVTFTPRNPGTYLYLDPENAPVNRVMGLFGGIVVNPVAPNDGNKITPYSGGELPVPANIQRLFNDLGSTAHFPGEAWDPNNWNLWIFGSIDPKKNKLVQQLGPGEVINPADFVNGYTPRFFYITGRQGFMSAHDEVEGNRAGLPLDHAIQLIGPAGRPRLIRNIAVGLDTESPHIHANHGYMLFENDPAGLSKNVGLQENLFWLDAWTMRPMNHKDVLYPFIKPPDIPDDTWTRLKNGTSQEGFPGNPMHQNADGSFRPGFPMFYPMHSHQELSQTGGGGNYPWGLITHIEFTGAVPGV
jgi:hypothetical protein